MQGKEQRERRLTKGFFSKNLLKLSECVGLVDQQAKPLPGYKEEQKAIMCLGKLLKCHQTKIGRNISII